MKAVLYGVLLLMLAGNVLFAQDPVVDDSYVNRNQIDYGPLKISSVTGIARDEHGTAVPSVRMLLFTEKEHKMIASATTDDKGMFSFRDIPYGWYRLVTKSAFCAANVPIEVGHFGKKQLHLHMIAGAIDTCSYGTLKN
jgi:hypothetical protein